MSGGNCPETPRQRMIGMMYLFLTAMLALNVSGELLKAFQLVDSSIQQTISTVEKKNKQLYNEFLNSKQANEAKVGAYYDKSQQVREAADKLANHIHDLKLLMVTTTQGSETTLETFTKGDNQDVNAQIMITEQSGGRSKELKKMFYDYKILLLSVVDTSQRVLRDNIERVLDTSDPEPKGGEPSRSWESEKFEHLPISASFALMSKMMSDVRNLEADVVRSLYNQIDEQSFKFTNIEPIVKPRSEVIVKGSSYYAEVIMAARDETMNPKFTLKGLADPTVENGKAIINIPASSTGSKTIEGTASVLGPNEEWVDRTFVLKYEVVEPMVVISPTKMNVFYEGVENPVKISVPGYSTSQLSVDIKNASYRKAGDEFLVTPNARTAGLKSTITVFAKEEGKAPRKVGEMDFRIKRIPPPIAKVGGINEGKLAKARLIAESGVFAEMEDFDFELEYKVTRFVVSTVKGGYLQEEQSSTNRFTEAQRELIKGLGRGSKVIINDIKAQGPDKVTRSLGSITITID